MFICKNCARFVVKSDRHRCTEITCGRCGVRYKSNYNHVCFITKKELEPNKKNWTVIYLDFETYNILPSNQFVPCLLCTEIICAVCQDLDDDDNHPIVCQNPRGCGAKKMTFEGPNLLNSFFEYLKSTHTIKGHQRIFLLAHNFSRFDGQFLYSYLISEAQDPKVFASDPLKTGNKLINIKIFKNCEMMDDYSTRPWGYLG